MGKMSLKLKIVQAVILGLTFGGILFLFGFILDEKFNIGQFIFQATFFGVFMGILFPVITQIQTKKILKKTIINLNEDEQLVYEGASTLKSKFFSSGGKLVLTNKRLAFKTHKLNFKNTFVEIPLNEITKVGQQDTLGFINNTFMIQKANEEFKFIVYENERDAWVSKTTEYSNKAS